MYEDEVCTHKILFNNICIKIIILLGNELII